MMHDWGREMTGLLYADSTAALGIAKRKGAGKLRHININAPWIQGVQENEGVEYRKVPGTDNPADLMTKYPTRYTIDKHMNAMVQVVRDGRAPKGLEMQGTHGGTPEEEGVIVRVAAISRGRPARYGCTSS